MATKSRIKKATRGPGVSVSVTISKTFGDDAFQTTALAPRVAFAEKVLAAGVTWMQENAPHDQGHLRESFTRDKNSSGITITGRDQRSVLVTIASGVDYARALDEGKRRRAGKMPPIAAIKRWMRRAGLGSDDQAAFLIARSVARRGVVTGPVFLEGRRRGSSTKDWIDGLQDAIRGEIDKQREQLLRDMTEDILGR